LGWILAIGVVWVFKGFKQHLSIDSNKNSVNNRPINPSTTSTGKTPLRTHYNNLKVAPNAPPEVIRAAYKTLSQKFHPDRNPGNLEAANIMAIINASYEVLSDPKQRQEHDRWITLQEHIAEQETNKSIKSNQKSHAGPLVSHILKNWLPYSTVIIFILWTITSGPHTLTTDQKKSQTTPAPVQSEYVRPSTAPNGTPWPLTADYIEGYQQTHTDGLSSLTVNNSQNDSDVFVKLVSIDSTQVYPVRQFFIPAFGNFTLNKVKAGMYDIRYRDLTHGGLSRSEAFKLHETTTYNGTEFSKITMTLYKVKNGNMQTYGLSEAEF